MSKKPHPRDDLAAASLLAILAAAHKRMDELHYPPCTRPIDDRMTEGSYSAPQAKRGKVAA